MALKYMSEYRDPEICSILVDQIRKIHTRPVRLMEVCGTHTMAIFRSGIRSLLPDSIDLISGPGCPVCVTAQKEIDAFIALTEFKDVILTTFGDLIRVPGTKSSLQKESARGRDVRVVYSTLDALKIAEKNPDKKIVFLGVGFETTAPTVAASIVTAKQNGLKNFFVLSAHKRVPPALSILLEADTVKIDGFLLPGHVTVIIGLNAYRPVLDKHHSRGVVAGFEPADILQGILKLIQQIEAGDAFVENAYARVVTAKGNQKAQEMIDNVFTTVDAVWRGIGVIPESGLKIREAYNRFDAESVFDIVVEESEDPKGCECGAVLTGVISPPSCPLFKTVCTPLDPVGPCMVSSEGTCAAYYRFHVDVDR